MIAPHREGMVPEARFFSVRTRNPEVFRPKPAICVTPEWYNSAMKDSKRSNFREIGGQVNGYYRYLPGDRAEVMAHAPAERLEYALDLLAFYLDPIPAFFDGIAQMDLALTNADARMLHALDARRGRFVSLNALVSARCLDRPMDEWTTPEKAVKKIGDVRRRHEKQELPVTIETWRGVGYSLHAPDWFRFENGLAALRAARTQAAFASGVA